MYHGNAETRKQRDFRESVERSIERAAKLNRYLQGRLAKPSPSSLYRPPHGGYPTPTNEDGAGI